jgi:hypothetical protein
MDLNRIIKKVLMEEESRSNRYMFFSNLQQMKRQCEMLLEMDQDEIESILENGHDWAQDHIAEAKNNMDQVFDFLKNETEGESDYEEKEDNDDEEDMVMVEGRKKKRRKKRRKKTGTPLCARGIASAKSKYDVYPSAYANGHAVQVCKGTIKGLDGKKHCSGAYC